MGLPAHERFVFPVRAEEAFGIHNPRLVERITWTAAGGHGTQENSVVEFGAPNGATFAGFRGTAPPTRPSSTSTIRMAGKPIRFEVEIIGIM